MAYIYEFSATTIALHGKITRARTLHTKIRATL